jgi:hypothetical protein
MAMNTTEKLELAAQYGCYVLFEKGAPGGVLKKDLITLRAQDGKALELRRGSFVSFPLQLEREEFDYWLAASFIEQDGSEDAEGRIKFRLTADGLSFAATGKAAS